MRYFIAFSIVLCIVGGLYLIQGIPMFWPDRFEPRHGLFLDTGSVRLLGASLLLIAGLGLMTIRHASQARGKAAPLDWQRRYFLGLVMVLGLISAAFLRGEPGPNPDSRPYSTSTPAQVQP